MLATLRGVLCIEPRAIEALGWSFMGWAYAEVETSASLRFVRLVLIAFPGSFGRVDTDSLRELQTQR
jgi:hypothetical protein